MSSINIILLLISGLGVLHGLFLATFLWTYPRGNPLSNRILSLLLLVLSFRVGKSVFLEFAEDLDTKLIFIGLATLMAIGPLFYLYALSLIDKKFQFDRKYLIHFIPTCIGLCFGVWINEEAINTLPKLFFVMIFATYYGHYLIYLFISYVSISKGRRTGLKQATYEFLRLLFFALSLIWIVYVLNLFEEFVPYIIGPILYTLIAYIISFIAIRKGYINTSNHTKYKTTPVPEDQVNAIFGKVQEAIISEKGYKNPEITLRTLSERLNLSTQVLSMVINKKSKSNFNSFINSYRVEESMKLFQTKQYDNHTIASIALEVGFNSITSFNTAFKKYTGKTPLVFRNELSK